MNDFNIFCSVIISWETNGKLKVPQIKSLVHYPMNSETPKLKCFLTDKANFKFKKNLKGNLEYSCIAFPLSYDDFNNLEKNWTSDNTFNIKKNEWNINVLIYDNNIYFYANNEKKGYVIGNLHERFYGKSVVSIISFYRDIFM